MNGNYNCTNSTKQDGSGMQTEDSDFQYHLRPTRQYSTQSQWDRMGVTSEEEIQSDSPQNYHPHDQAVPVKDEIRGHPFRSKSLQHPSDLARTVSRPELVVAGLKDMCNLVESSEPAMRSSTSDMTDHSSSSHIYSCTSNFSCPLLPPPTPFDPEQLIQTERMFSDLALSVDPPEDRENVVRSRSTQQKKTIPSPRRSLSHVQSQPLHDEGQSSVGVDDAKICQVLYSMMSQLDDGCGPEEDVSSESPVSSLHDSENGVTVSPGSRTISLVRSQLNAASIHRSLRSKKSVQSSGTEHISEDIKNHHKIEYSPPQQHQISYQKQKLDINNNPIPDTRAKPKVWSNLTQSFFRDGIEYQQPQQDVSPQSKQCDNHFSCQCDLYRPKVKSKTLLKLNTKSTSTTDIPATTPVEPVPMSYAVMQPQSEFGPSPSISVPGRDAQQQQHKRGYKYPMTPRKSCPVSIGDESGIEQQQPVPIYILQSGPNQQMPIFLVQNGGNPGDIMGQNQGSIFIQEIQHEKFPPRYQNQNPPYEAQTKQSKVTNATRVETRTLVKHSTSIPQDHVNLKHHNCIKEIDYSHQKLPKKDTTKTLQKRPEHIQSKPLWKPRDKPVQIIDNDETEITFIVGPSAVELESQQELEILHSYPQSYLQKHGSHSKPVPRPAIAPLPREDDSRPTPIRKGESVSDSEINRAKMRRQQEREQETEPIVQQDQENRFENEYDDDDNEEENELATLTTSSQTVTIHTSNSNDSVKYDRPYITSSEEQEQDEEQSLDQEEEQGEEQEFNEEEEGQESESVCDVDCTLVYRVHSNSSVFEQKEPLPQEDRDEDRPKHRDIGVGVREKRYKAVRHHRHKEVAEDEKQSQEMEEQNSREKSKQRIKKAENQGKSEIPGVEIHGLFPTNNEAEEERKPSFMKEKKAVTDQRANDSVSVKSVSDAISLIEDTTSWERNVVGLKVISLQVQFHEGNVLERLPCVVASIQRHIRASGSKLARQAILTLRDLFISLGPHFDPFLYSLSERLFSKMANTNKFIKDDCEATLASMVDHCSQPKTIQILENVARRHKHAMIRLVAGRMITKFVRLVGPNSALEDYSPLILPLLCCNLLERAGEIRDEARNSFRLLLTNPDFDAYLRHNVSPQFIFSICEKLDRIREEVSKRPRIRTKISRNQSLFKWQQKYSNTNMM